MKEPNLASDKWSKSTVIWIQIDVYFNKIIIENKLYKFKYSEKQELVN